MAINEEIDNFLCLLKDYNEETSTQDQWNDLQLKIVILLNSLNELTKNDLNIFNPLLSLLYCGLMGNFISTGHLSNENIKSELMILSNNILENSNLSSIEDWLLESKKNNKTLCTKLIELITNSLKNKTLATGFLFRDAGLWLIFKLSYPKMTDYSSGLLPIALNVADSCVTNLAIIGIQSLSHIAKNSLKAHLRYYGQADLIYETMKKNIYTQNLEIFKIIIPCLLEFLQSFDIPPCKRTSLSTKINYSNGYDELLRFILQDLYICSNFDKRIVLIIHLNSINDLIGCSMIKFTKQYLKSFETVLLAPEMRNIYPIVKEMILENFLNVFPNIQIIIKFVLIDLLRVLFAFIDESLEFSPEKIESSNIVNLMLKIFELLSGEHRDKISRIYKTIEGSLINRKNFQIFNLNKVMT